ncbi:MAG: orotidine-5'-phosphate decarboxylase [Patescibacteria group bacterium]|nr:orotidine-5'-phosphate decarboxylase [Patescibacteria group bacterium]
MNFADKLIQAVKIKGNPICVGLDPRLEQIPAQIISKANEGEKNTKEAAAEALKAFNKGIIDAVADLVPCVKPQIAFYEQYGWAGFKVYEETCAYAQEKGLLVIADAKRNDIGSTAKGYAGAFLGKVPLFGGEVAGLDADALTVNAYLGWDGVKPFAQVCRDEDKGIFILVKTSNISSGDLQDQELLVGKDKMQVYELMAHFVDSWGADLIGESGYSSIGAVVGATYPQQAKVLRKMMPHAIFLVPGYGAQGGEAEDVKPCFNEDGLGAIVNSSRGIIFAYENDEKYGPENYADAARDAVVRMKEDLRF